MRAQPARRSRVLVSTQVAGETASEAFLSGPERWLPAPARRRGTDSWTIVLTGASLRHPVVCRIGPPWTSGSTSWRHIDWHPVPDAGGRSLRRAVPAFEGDLGLHRHHDRSRLQLEGVYDPPGAAPGRAVDRAMLHRVAVQTVRHLIEAIAARLAQPGPHTRSALSGQPAPGTGSGRTP